MERRDEDATSVRRAGWSSLERQLPLWAFVLILGALVVYGILALQEVRSALMSAGRARLGSVTQQLTDLLTQSMQQRLQETRALAARPEVAAFLAANPPAAASPAAAPRGAAPNTADALPNTAGAAPNTAAAADNPTGSAVASLPPISAAPSSLARPASPDAAAGRAAAEAVLRQLLTAQAPQKTTILVCDATGAERLNVSSAPASMQGPPPRTFTAGVSPFQVQNGTVYYDVIEPIPAPTAVHGVRAAGPVAPAGMAGPAGAAASSTSGAPPPGAAHPRRPPIGHLVIRRYPSSPQAVATIQRLIGSGATLLLGNRDTHDARDVRSGIVWTDMIRTVPPPVDHPEVALHGAVTVQGRGGAPVIGRATLLAGTPWWVWMELDQGLVLAPVRRMEDRFAVVGALVLLLAAATAWLLSRTVTRPIRQLTLSAAAVAGGDFSRRVDEPAPVELGRLARSFNHMSEELATARADLETRVTVRTRELAEALNRLQETQAELVREAKLATIGRLASSVGHELRNPLAVMTNAVYYLDAVLGDVPPQVRDYFGILRHEIALSEKIVGDLLDFARVKPPQLQAIQLPEVVEHQIERLGDVEGVSIVRQYEDGLPPAWADASQVGQILMNLLSNAAQAVGERAGTITVRGRRAGQRVVVEVEDDGTGIPADLRERIFEPLFTTKARGIGLGLSVSRTLAEANSGTLRLDPAPGRGALFVLELAAAAA